MAKLPAILVLDVGKTNKKLFLFNQDYRIVSEVSERMEEIADEDGFPCEDLPALQRFFRDKLQAQLADSDYHIRALNVSAYGASFVSIDASGRPVTPLYNYLKPYPQVLQQQFYQTYGGEATVALETASPVLGSLNSGLQLYRLRHEKPAIWAQVKYALHLPQYLTYLLSKNPVSDITSIGCHTALWHLNNNTYHGWVNEEGILPTLAPIMPCTSITEATIEGHALKIGTGLHDSSAALIPYLATFDEPFLLLSTGTWCISLNPFNNSALTAAQLRQDCLCYMTYQGSPVKAARLFAGHFHEQQAKRMAAYFQVQDNFFSDVQYDAALVENLKQRFGAPTLQALTNLADAPFVQRNLHEFTTVTEAYTQLVMDIVAQQVYSTNLALEGWQVSKLFVDGGFGNNRIFMNLLAQAYPQLEVFAAEVPQATALGAAVVLHEHWNPNPDKPQLVTLQRYS
jgi:sugar (pentulose or hexulose) kinase